MNRFASALLFLFLMGPFAVADDDSSDGDAFFELKIRPILSNTCFKCHGGEKVSNGLRLNSRENLLTGGDNGPAIVPGNPEESLLIKAIRYSDEHLKMPPNKRLSDEQIADFGRWVRTKAPWPNSVSLNKTAAGRHWAFQPVKVLEPPSDPTGWSETSVDRFVAAKWREQGIRPVTVAGKRTLVRRVYFDLIGLPPTPREVEAFLADESPEAYRRLVDQLLASPQYGERWGRHWMDVARYADTAGDNADYPVPEARLYRDYIIDSFNSDKPYDQFVREQLTGDILAKHGPKEKYAEQIVATGFLALSRRYATGPYELWHLTLEDAIETTGRAFMGLTLRCARCHDHKFDPVTKEDYYALYGIIASTQFPWAGAEEFASMKKPREHFAALLPANEASPRMAAHHQRLQQLTEEIVQAEKANVRVKIPSPVERQSSANGKELQAREPRKQKNGPSSNDEFVGLLEELQKRDEDRLKKLAQLRAEREKLLRSNLPVDLPGAYAVQEGKAIHANIQIRGEVNQLGPVVKRNVIKYLSQDCPVTIPEGSSGRLELACWLTRLQHPLTARVMVNRIWQHHFGKGLVGTPSNFGLRGAEPTHPELLDWLATQFVKSGWSMKAIHRSILLSKTYRLSSNEDEADAQKDPGNRWHWRYERRRLDAEAIRDAILAVSGNLDLSRPGAHPFPPMDKWGWTQHNPFKEIYPSNHRSVYLMTQRLQRHPFLALFDSPDTNTTTDVRSTSTVPLQALFMMNDPFMTEQAESFARRLTAESTDPQMRIDFALRLAWGRPARSAEIDKAMKYAEAIEQELIESRVPSERLQLEKWTSYARVILSANEFMYVD
jgi:mono/diheme cytochrome c family protein